MNTSNSRDVAIGWQFRIQALCKHAILKLDLAIIEQQFEAVARKKLLLLSIASMVFLRAALFDTLDLAPQFICTACHSVVSPVFRIVSTLVFRLGRSFLTTLQTRSRLIPKYVWIWTFRPYACASNDKAKSMACSCVSVAPAFHSSAKMGPPSAALAV